LDEEGERRKLLVWDAPTRLFHWLLAVLVLAAYVTYRLNWVFSHVLAGEAVLALVLFRILWGFLGSETTRFTSFVATPGSVARYLADVLRGRASLPVGHNPAGGWMILLMLALLLGETVSGVFVNNDVASVGPMSDMMSAGTMNLMTELHRLFWDALAASVALHLLAILYYAVALRQNLLWPMITGRIRAPGSEPPPRLAGWRRAAWLFTCGVLAAAAIVNYL